MRPFALATVLSASLATMAFAQDHRELGPHVHGAGSLKIAIEGGKLSMDFSAPAADILGFEHQPSTPEQAKTLADAKDSLAKPLTLFVFPAQAGCTATSANVVFNAAAPGNDAAPAKDAEAQHADFDIDYVIECKAAGKIDAISFPYFKRFPGAQKLTVTVVSERGQSEFEVVRANPAHAIP